jgi:hypothetical protein
MYVIYGYCLDKLKQSNMAISESSMMLNPDYRIIPSNLYEGHPLYSLLSRYKSVRTPSVNDNGNVKNSVNNNVNNVELEDKKDNVLDDGYYLINP